MLKNQYSIPLLIKTIVFFLIHNLQAVLVEKKSLNTDQHICNNVNRNVEFLLQSFLCAAECKSVKVSILLATLKSTRWHCRGKFRKVYADVLWHNAIANQRRAWRSFQCTQKQKSRVFPFPLGAIVVGILCTALKQKTPKRLFCTKQEQQQEIKNFCVCSAATTSEHNCMYKHVNFMLSVTHTQSCRFMRGQRESTTLHLYVQTQCDIDTCKLDEAVSTSSSQFQLYEC